ncbi:suppressor of fused domain protein [Bizionia paragorgiae]|uniref:Suppressor of fused protein (SUFU) n=1 Tax=Bizionia paragorgiae TaxID=283786 RepID=A0A1H3XUT9_BIZPA|nr:suppressor of fused domain protein [Bizionia paragorgiae]SEA03209.1 Suppressor of fused protein (SUFU) [Bizionia paragorgiae]
MNFFTKLFSSRSKALQKAQVLLEVQSPTCPITAIVEQDQRVAYFYLYGPEHLKYGIKSCWIRNLKKAPIKLETQLMNKGIPPMLPKAFCKFPEGQEKLDPKDLKVLWTEEGDAAALSLNDEVIAIIPSWSGQNGFYGYARDCKGEGNFAWELDKSNSFLDRIDQSQVYWESWDDSVTPFQKQQPEILKAYDLAYGKHDKYFAINGDTWPPRGLFLKQGEAVNLFATVGLSLLPMPVVERFAENRFKTNRIELGMILNGVLSEKDMQKLTEWISGQASIPWDNITFLGEGHTISFKPLDSMRFNTVVLTNSLDIFPKVKLERYRKSVVNFLWMVPISERERDHIINKGSAHVLEQLNAIGNEVFSIERDEVI